MWQPRLWRTACGAGSTNHHAGDPISSILPSKTEHDIGLFGGLRGLMPRRRCQPSGGAARSEPVFPTKREGPARRRRRHAMTIEVLVPPGADRVAIRIATRVAIVYTNAPKRPREAIFGDLCTLLRPPASPRGTSRDATVYTNAPKRCGEAVFVDLCTLLRPHVCPQQRNSPTVYTNAPIRRGEARSSHLCTLLRSQGHPQPKPTAQQCTQMPQNGPERLFSSICVHSCVTARAVTPTPPGR